MSHPVLPAALKASLSLALLLAATTAMAQMPRPFVMASAELAAWSSDEPSFRDPKTGQVWTPSTVSQDGKPLNPDDSAFNPGGQAVPAGQAVDQYARVTHIGRVPITAGPTVPLVEIDNPSLRVRPGRTWRIVVYLQNNSESMLAPVLGCRFGNGDKTVQNTRVMVPPTEGGDRLGLVFFGPPSTVFVDTVSCYVISP